MLPHDSLRMNSTKSMIGHLLGGAGAVEAVATIKAVESGWLHPTLNLETPDEGVDPVIVCAGAKQQVGGWLPISCIAVVCGISICHSALPPGMQAGDVLMTALAPCIWHTHLHTKLHTIIQLYNHHQVDMDVALSNSFGFGGHNSVVAFAPFKA